MSNAQSSQMKNSLFTLLLGAFTLTGLLAQNVNAQTDDTLMALHDDKNESPNGSRATDGNTFIEISWDRISKDAIINFSPDLMGRKFHIIDQADEIFLSKKISASGMGIDLHALSPGNYYIVSKPRNSPAITNMFIVE